MESAEYEVQTPEIHSSAMCLSILEKFAQISSISHVDAGRYSVVISWTHGASNCWAARKPKTSQRMPSTRRATVLN